ncbi:MAG: hypothetical protein IPP49_20810 [Saprospiraceae bacterium]|nr:hypothetical protein [Saprospiraceae bacterium]
MVPTKGNGVPEAGTTTVPVAFTIARNGTVESVLPTIESTQLRKRLWVSLQ